MIYSHTAIAVLAAALAGTCTYKVQDWRYSAKEAALEKSQLANIRLSAAASIRRADNVIAAQNEATARMVRLRRDSDLSRTQLQRLRAQIASGVPGTGDTAEACTERTDTIKKLFSECAGELTEMGARADRHSSDVETLMSAWPK